MKTLLPFLINIIPMRKLALINFEKQPDSIYNALELQYLASESLGKGYRVLAYRVDQKVDIYEEKTLKYNPDEEAAVVGKGLNQYVQTDIRGIIFDKTDNGLEISFAFTDIIGRSIHFELKEKIAQIKRPMNLLAPIGVGSERPTYLPLFFLYEFDFIRRRGTEVNLHIADHKITLDKFPAPVPVNGAFRYFARYSMNCQIVEFLPTTQSFLDIELDDKLEFTKDDTVYSFKQNKFGYGLYQIEQQGSLPLTIQFNPPLFLTAHSGGFTVKPLAEMGELRGDYLIEETATTLTILLNPSKGWKSKPQSWIEKIILSPKTVFSKWSKNYYYKVIFDKEKHTTQAQWTNHNIK